MGKNKYIETPEKLWELFIAYKKNVEDNPRIKIEYVGRNGEKVKTPLETPLTMVGFECYVMDNTKVTCPDLTNYFEKTEGYEDYFPISTRIRKKIRENQTIGGLTGQLNANLTARINGYKEQSETVNTTEIKILNIDPLDDSKD